MTACKRCDVVMDDPDETYCPECSAVLYAPCAGCGTITRKSLLTLVRETHSDWRGQHLCYGCAK